MGIGISGIRQGRYVKRGVTWWTAGAALAIIALVAVGLGSLASVLQPDYPVTITVIDDRVVDDDVGCARELDLELRNDSDRRLRLISIEVADRSDSRQGLIGAFDMGASVPRTFRYELAACTRPATEQLVLRYGPAMTTKIRSTTFTVESGTG